MNTKMIKSINNFHHITSKGINPVNLTNRKIYLKKRLSITTATLQKHSVFQLHMALQN